MTLFSSFHIIFRPFPLSLPALCLAGLLPASNLAATEFTGLWVGEAQVNQVSEVVPSQTGNPRTGTPVPAEGVLRLRLLIHVDAAGEVNLLKWGTLMARRQVEEGSGGNPQETFKTILVTRPSVFFEADVVGKYPEDDGRVGQRFFTTSFDWDGSDADSGNQLALSGSFLGNGTLTATLQLSAQNAVNPFYHRFHPMHQEGRAVTREITITIDPVHGGALGSGPDQVTGRYGERIFGLNGVPSDFSDPSPDDPFIALGGQFTLRRISSVPELN